MAIPVSVRTGALAPAVRAAEPSGAGSPGPVASTVLLGAAFGGRPVDLRPEVSLTASAGRPLARAARLAH